MLGGVAAFSAAPWVSAQVDPQYRVGAVLATVLVLLVAGQMLGGLLGRALSEVLPIAREQGIVARLDRVYQTGEPFHGQELEVQLPAEAPFDGRQVFINVVYQPLRDAQGRSQSLSGLAR